MPQGCANDALTMREPDKDLTKSGKKPLFGLGWINPNREIGG
jgi:hypothetical protein